MFTKISNSSKDYPKKLLALKNPPKQLFVNNLNLLNREVKYIAVVGSRRNTSYGKKVTRHFVNEFVMNGYGVISGFMYGIDMIAHQTTLDSNGVTIGVLPCGYEVDFMNFYKQTYKRVLQQGVFVTEYSAKVPPKKWTFVKRNRIVAALADAVLVVEASNKSGALITAAFAMQLNKPVYVIPHEIYSKNSGGCNGLIYKGAVLVSSPNEILRKMNGLY